MDAGRTVGYFVLLLLYTDLVSLFHLEFIRITSKNYAYILLIYYIILKFISIEPQCLYMYTCCRTAQIVLVFFVKQEIRFRAFAFMSILTTYNFTS